MAEVLAFITHQTCNHFYKASFGSSSAPEAKDPLLCGLPSVIWYMENVVVFAKSKYDLEKRGLKLNSKKFITGLQKKMRS